MVHPDAVDELRDEIDLSSAADKAQRFEELGASLAEDEYGRSTFFTLAAEHRLLEGDYDAAERDLRLGGPGHDGERLLHPLATWLDWAQRSGRIDEVERIVVELMVLWRSDALAASTAHHVGELMEVAGDLKRAHRWFTLPLTHVDPDDNLEWDEEMCVLGRARVRRLLGLPQDRYDVLAAELIAAG